jgi:uncharacterized membrane protein
MATTIDDQAGRCFVLKPNIGVYWRTTVWVFVALSVVCLGIALAFAAAGFWPILPFAGLEVFALGAALYVSARRGRYREVVRIDAGAVTIEKGFKAPERRWTFERAWSEVCLRDPVHRWYPTQLTIRSGNAEIELGAFLTDQERATLAAELTRCIGPMGRGGVDGNK